MSRSQNTRRRTDSRSGIHNQLLAFVAVVSLVGTLWFNAKTTSQATEQLRQADAGQVSERFSRSVEQLGSTSVAARAGAVYSFARLMRDSRGDQQAIVEILSAFIKTQAAQADPALRARKWRTAPADLLAALKVLDEQPVPRERRETDGTVTSWPSMMLDFVDLSHFDLRAVRMRGASLNGSNLSGALLTKADLRDSQLKNANGIGTTMWATDLTNVTLERADLTGAILSAAVLSNTDLLLAELHGANLRRADLSKVTHLGAALLVGAKCSPETVWPPDVAWTPDHPKPSCGQV